MKKAHFITAVAAIIAIAMGGQFLSAESAQPAGSGQAKLVSRPRGICPEPVTGPDGHRGWRLRLPENRPLATPAYWEGLLFVGGGFGSYEFYALDAASGRVVWQFHTGDDGPTAAVVSDGYVAFNTESCILYVLRARTGELVWQKWLGDPLMSMPAISGDRLFMAYPGSDGRHYLACFGLRNGREFWRVPIAG